MSATFALWISGSNAATAGEARTGIPSELMALAFLSATTLNMFFTFARTEASKGFRKSRTTPSMRSCAVERPASWRPCSAARTISSEACRMIPCSARIYPCSACLLARSVLAASRMRLARCMRESGRGGFERMWSSRCAEIIVRRT